MAGQRRHSKGTLLSDEEVRQRQMADPAVQARVEEILQGHKNGKPGSGIPAEELQDFLREHNG